MSLKISTQRLPFESLVSLICLAFLACASQNPQSAKNPYAKELELAKAAAQRSLMKNHLDYNSLSDLHYAAGWGPLELVQYILKRDGEIDVRDSAGRTPFFLSAGFNKTPVLDFLLSKGAELEAKNNFGSRAIHLAAGFNSDKRILQLLINAGADVNDTNDLESSPLHWAENANAAAHKRLLLENGAQ